MASNDPLAPLVGMMFVAGEGVGLGVAVAVGAGLAVGAGVGASPPPQAEPSAIIPARTAMASVQPRVMRAV